MFAGPWLRWNGWRSSWPARELARRGYDAYFVGHEGEHATRGWAQRDTVVLHATNQDWAGRRGAVLSPVLGAAEFELLSKVVGPPLLVAMLQRRPEMLPMVKPILMPMLLDVFKEFKKHEKQMEEGLANLMNMSRQEVTEEFKEFLTSIGLGDESPDGYQEQPPPEDEEESPSPNGQVHVESEPSEIEPASIVAAESFDIGG